MKTRLSATELQYATQHQALLQNHYDASFFHNFPEQLRRLDDTAGGISMVQPPDLDAAVFCRVLRDSDEVLPVGGTGTVLELRKGNVHVVRYSVIRQ